MEPRLQLAFKAMEELDNGAIANPDGGRIVGHYWLRNPKLAPNSILRLQIENTLGAVCKFADDVVSGKIKPPTPPEVRFTQILSVGIGGSALGPQFVAEALAPDNPPLKIRFIDNIDPAGIDHQIAQLGSELASTLIIEVSKSGGTPETRNGLLEVQKAFREAGLDFAKQGTRSVLYANGRESISVTVQEVTPISVVALVALYELAVGIYASLVNVNAYHQPGVEAWEKAAGEVLALQKRVLAVLSEARLK